MIEILIGNIASGKSTYAKERAKEGAIIVNDDAIVTALHAGEYNLYSKDLKPLYKAIENQIIMTAVVMGHDVIVDRGLNITWEARQRLVGLGRSLDQEVVATLFVFEDPRIHASRRVKSDSRGYSYNYWLDVAERMQKDYQVPTRKEGFTSLKIREAFPLAESLSYV